MPAPAHPSGDKRFKMLDAAMKKHHHQPDALLEVLHTAQELFGFLEPDLLWYIAHGLRLPPSRVSTCGSIARGALVIRWICLFRCPSSGWKAIRT